MTNSFRLLNHRVGRLFCVFAWAIVLHPGVVHAQRASMFNRTDPAVEQWMIRAQRGPKFLGESISALARMSEYEQVESLLKSLGSANYDAEQEAVVASQIEARLRLKLTASTQISAASKLTLDNIFESRAKVLQASERIGGAVKSMNARSADASLPAIRQLFEGGEASTARLAAEIVAAKEVSQRDHWLRAIMQLDREQGLAALRRLALYGSANTRAGALSALARVSMEDFPVDFMTALYRIGDDQKPSADSQVAAAAFAGAGLNLPPRDEAIRYVRKQLAEANRIAIHSKRDYGRTTDWSINSERNGVVLQRLADWVLDYRRAADMASRLIVMGDDEPASVIEQTIASVAYRVAGDASWGSDEQLAEFRKTALGLDPANVEPGRQSPWLSTALHVASESGNVPGVIGLIRLTHSMGVPASEMLAGHGASVSPLVRLLQHPNAPVRYEAAGLIVELLDGVDGSLAYPGSGRVRARLEQMAKMGNRPLAVTLENRPEIIAEWERVLDQAGYEARFVSTMRQLEACVASGEDIRLVLVKAEPKDATAIEVVDSVRRVRVTRDTPILVYTEAEVVVIDQDSLDADVEVRDEDSVINEVASRFGAFSQPDSLDDTAEKDLLNGKVDVDSSYVARFDVQAAAQNRWTNVSSKAGLIRYSSRPRSIAGLYELLLENRRLTHIPPLGSVDRRLFRQLAQNALRDAN